ncbi:MAG: ubiquinol-cytochrome C chaperone family protein [Methyloligellaceae bacterium]
MILHLIRQRSEKKRRAQQVYGSIVALARRPEFYRFWRVPDTINGRFDMIVLHLFLLLQRLKQDGEQGTEAGRLVIEAFFSDMDRSVREQGAGDLSVPKHVRKMADALYGRLETYRAAEEDGEGHVLAQALRRNIFPDADDDDAWAVQSAAAIALYMQDVKEYLRNLSFETVMTGAIDFPKISSQPIEPEK